MGQLYLTGADPGAKTEASMHLEQGVEDAVLPVDEENKDDPLNWPYWQKVYIVGLVAILSFTAQFSSALINPGYVEMSEDLKVTVEQCSYCTTIFILFSGVAPLLVVPFANVYGRRILYVLFMVLATAGDVLSAAASTYGGVVTGRVLNGIGSSIPLGIGAATICDLFRQHERGLFMGIYTLSVTNGPHLAPIVGGYVTQRLGWRWCFWIPAICQGFLWILLICTLPETLFSREQHSKLENSSFARRLLYHGKVLDRPIRLRDFGTSFRMIKYAAVTLPSIYYCTCNTYGSALFAVTGSRIGSATYRFKTQQTGLFMGVPLTVGCAIGEASAGWVSDAIINVYARRHNGYRKAEARLFLVPLCTLLCIGTATYGFCVENERPWIQAAICMAVSGLGSQVATTMVYTYCTDSYKSQSGEIGVVINLFKSVFAFNVGFYALPFGAKVGFTEEFSTLAAINAATLIPLVFLMFKGEEIRMRQGVPDDHRDL
ncbi:hypothetical protein VTN00DRAFT_289 [Thermoascus crustaceus]|uniref:uncharacterized protein n=1 Tax=Thermoascus crustaceus TaxID=5088 RepID=UPI003744629B